MKLLLLLLLLTLPASAAPPASQKTPAPRFLMAHYMPWFEAKPTSQGWGWHWTMGHFKPDETKNGRQEAASHFRPLIGLYDSSDPDALECHVLLMKLAGMDGVIVDWYGTDDFADYAVIQRNTQSLVGWIKRARLKFAICFEDQTVPKLIAEKRIPEAEAVAHGQTTLQWMQTHWFSDPAYLKQNGRPVFLVFGAGYYQGAQWAQIFAPLPIPPQFYTESEPRPPAVGAFDWPKPGDANAQNLFYAHAKNWPDLIPAAFPRFQDFYAEASVQKSYGRIDDNGGKTYTETLERALQSRASVIQLVTWNDWGEGTQIEPSVEFGYRDLEATQRLRRQYMTPKIAHTAADLRLPVALYKLRKTFAGQPAVQSKLDAVSRHLLAGRPSQARALLAKLHLTVAAGREIGGGKRTVGINHEHARCPISASCPPASFAARAAPPPALRPKLLVLNYDPIIEAEGGKRLHVVCGWRDSRELVKNHIADLREVSHGQVQFQVAEWRDLDEFPVKADGFRYTDETYLACWRAKGGWHQPDAIDYKAILTQFDIPRRVASGEWDEVWILSSPYTGTWESTMAGRGAYWCNSEPIPNVDCPKVFVVMGFNFERAEAEMIHDWGHRAESILNHVYGEWDNKHPKTPWDKFSLVGKDAAWPAPAGLGNTHYPPNALKDYEYGSAALVESTADDWLTYPKLTGKTSLVNRDSWASERFPAAETRRAGKVDYQLGFLKWWFSHLPHAPGRDADGRWNDWWPYLVSPNLGLQP